MSLNTLFLIAALISLFLGVPALVMPTRILASRDPAFLLTFQKLGAAALVVGILAWQARGISNEGALNVITLAFFLFYGFNAVLTSLGILKGNSPSSEWIFSTIDGLLALGFAYFRFLK
jgi:hypothetical protein